MAKFPIVAICIKDTLTLIAFISIIVTIVYCSNNMEYVLSLSSFSREDIEDPYDDVATISLFDKNNSQFYLNNTCNKYFSSIDIGHVNYFSDGKTLNATIWLSGFDIDQILKTKRILSFGMLIDPNPSLNSGEGKIGYHKEVIIPKPADLPDTYENVSSGWWINDVHETLDSGYHRYISIIPEDFTKILKEQKQIQPNYVYYIPLTIDMKDISNPDKLKVMFFSLMDIDEESCNGYVRGIDFTNWIEIPSPKYTISTFPTPIELRPEESKNISGILKSSYGTIPNVTKYNIDNENSVIKVNPQSNSFASETQVKNAEFLIKVPNQVQSGEYIIPIMATISTGSTLLPYEFSTGINMAKIPNTTGYTDVQSNLTLKILEPLDFTERFKEFWDVFGQPISIVLGGFVGGMASLLFDRWKKPKKRKWLVSC